MTRIRSPSVLIMSGSSTPNSCTFVPVKLISPEEPELELLASEPKDADSSTAMATSGPDSNTATSERRTPSSRPIQMGNPLLSKPYGPTRSVASSLIWSRTFSQSSKGMSLFTNWISVGSSSTWDTSDVSEHATVKRPTDSNAINNLFIFISHCDATTVLTLCSKLLFPNQRFL